MKHEENSRTYHAEEGKTIRRKSDNFNMGTGICLGTQDSIDNYYEDDMTEEELAEVKKREEEHLSRFKAMHEERMASMHTEREPNKQRTAPTPPFSIKELLNKRREEGILARLRTKAKGQSSQS